MQPLRDVLVAVHPINTRTTLLVEYAFWEDASELLARYELAHIPVQKMQKMLPHSLDTIQYI